MSVEKRARTASLATLFAGAGGTPANSSMIADDVVLEEWPGQQAHATQLASHTFPWGQQSEAS